MTPVLGCELCRRPLELAREPWTKRPHPKSGRELLVCELCAKGLDGQRDLDASAALALEEDAASLAAVPNAVRAGERAARREPGASPYRRVS